MHLDHVGTHMVNFDIRGSLAAGFALHWSWVWILFWSSMFYSAAPKISFAAAGPLDSLESLWVLSFTGMLSVMLVLLVLSRRYAPYGSKSLLVFAAGFVTSLGTVMVAQPSLMYAPDAMAVGYAIGAVLTGVGSGIEIVLWGELMTALGSRQTVVYMCMATILSAVAYYLVILIPQPVGNLLTSVFPAIEMLLFSRRRPAVSYDSASAQPVNSARDWVSAFGGLLGLSLLFGTSYGIMKGLFVLRNNEIITVRDLCNVLALILSSVCVLVSMARFRMNFRRLTWQVAFPLMALGFLLLPLRGVGYLIGFSVHQFGYQYFYTIIWALWSVYAMSYRVPRSAIACIGLLGVQGGQMLGSVIGAVIAQAAQDTANLAIVSGWLAFTLMMVALFAFARGQSGFSWGNVRPFDQDSKVKSSYMRSLLALAEAYGLSSRETEVLVMFAHGRNKPYIAKELVVSESTVKTHVKHIYAKMGVHSQQDLIDMIEMNTGNDRFSGR